jgi:hypothetical protein
VVKAEERERYIGRGCEVDARASLKDRDGINVVGK